MPPTHDTPWGKRTISKVEEALIHIDVLLADIENEEERAIMDNNRDAIQSRREGLTMLELVDFMTEEDGTINRSMLASLKRATKANKDQLKQIHQEQEESRKKIMSLSRTLPAREEMVEIDAVTFEMAKNKVAERIGYNERILSLLGRTQNGSSENEPLDIQRAKAFPISDLIEFKHGFACCIWHNERTGSMKYYPKTNHVHCYGCQKHGDAIDVVQQLHNLDLRGAVKFLTK